MVPKGWMLKQLSDIVKEKISYGIVQAGPHIPNGIPYIKSSDIRGAIDPASLQRTAPEIHYKYRRSAVHPGDIIFSLRGNIGETAIVPSNLLEANLTQGTARISVSGDQCNEFYHQQFAMDKLRNYINSLSKGSTFKEISLEELRKVKVLCAPLPEQKKIAQILSTWDKAITVTEKLLVNSQQQKKALMQQLLTGKKRLLDENGVRFSGEWVYLTFDNAFIVANKKSTQVKSSDYLQSGSIPIIDQGQSRIAGYCNNLEVYSDVPVIVFGDHTRCVKWIEFVFCPGADGTQVIKTSKILEPKLGYYLLSNTDIPNLGYSRHMRELKEKDFRLPLDIKEQQKIAAVLSAADAEISTLENKLACLKDEKKALMQQLLTGKRRVKVDEAVAV
ncbi:TPA: restriction endonuclease subunit S [Enterobacter hormaechei]|uniref:restriction endonuclease subunit S n=1 Tax=Enterobacter cloacae complex TaxID=354276 RepID=UPI000F841E88|nr:MULTISPECIES: restriction endonuclease subunit S [Enterobacter cloacae complex]EHN8873106.1 restriction endonuclease subunit S [Enterobacter hormaechei]MBT2108209.1 restriction endonuclease subunit S [Enterobacter hormaechei subsp. xiangfangensis]MCE1439158.1 restriction endonuclease subunit S [Enterobacter hormaechei]MCK7194992.1 restriction endonuclease subunit S [Enterobacter kobei]MCM7253972.1 restriction endonuclease subunit S [Enterobacter hormaechei]